MSDSAPPSIALPGAPPDDRGAEPLATEDPLDRSGASSSSLRSGRSEGSGGSDDAIARDLVAGRVFAGPPVMIDRFVVERLVGTGASAEVYAARDPVLERRVAIKVLGRSRGTSDAVIREARAMARVSHPNVVAIHEVGRWRDRPFIAMELIDGTTLATWLTAERRTVPAILAAFLEAGRGLAAAHAAGHVHRDFKPANVLVAHDGRVLVSDFGLVDDAPRAGDAAPPVVPRAPAGTPAYAAPEQRGGAAAHPSADVYSFALAVVEAVIGRHPMPEASAAWRAMVRAKLPRRLARALGAALAVQPAQRTQSMAPLLAALVARPRATRRRVVAALAIGAAAFGLGSWRPARWHRAPALPASPRSLLPGEIFSRGQDLLATPPGARDDAWDERVRTWLMLPIPTRIACPAPAGSAVMKIVGGSVVALDVQGEVTSCDLSTHTVRAVASNARCLSALDATTFAITLRHGEIAVYGRAARGWRRISADGPAVDPRIGDAHASECPLVLVSHGIAPPKLALLGPDAPPLDGAAFGGGDRVAIASARGLELRTGDAAAVQLLPAPVRWIAADEALHYAALRTADQTVIYDLDSRTQVAAQAVSPARTPTSGCTAMARDGARAIAVELGGALLWWRRGDRAWHRQPLALGGACEAKLNRRGDRVLLASGMDRIEVREIESGRAYALADAHIDHAAFLDDDHVVAIDESRDVWRWALGSQRSWLLADHGGAGRMWGFAICDAGTAVLTASTREDQEILIAATNGAPQATLPVPPHTQVYSLACHGDRVLAGTRHGRLLAWDRATGQPLPTLDLGIDAWIWTIATADPAGASPIELLGAGLPKNARTGGTVVTARGDRLASVFTARREPNTGIDEIAVSADGRRAAAVSSSGQLAVIDLARATATWVVEAHRGEARRVRFTDGDRTLVTVGDDGYLRTWRADDGAAQAKLHLGHGKVFDLDVHGTVALVATSDGHVGTWDLTTQRLIQAYAGHATWVAKARFDASGTWIASGDREGVVCLHRVGVERCHASLVGHRAGAIAHVGFLGDGQIITVSEDGTARQWRPPYDASRDALACELEARLFGDAAIGASPGCDEPRTRPPPARSSAPAPP